MLKHYCSTLGYAFINANEFELTISLVVFVMLTAILLTLLICLCASKSFRTLFFRETRHNRNNRARKKDTSNPETVAIGARKTSRKTNKADHHPEYFNGILTVPIDGGQINVDNGSADNSAEKADVFDDIPTVAIPPSRSSSVYTVRNIKTSNAKTDNVGNKQAQSGKKRTASTTVKPTSKKTVATAKTGAVGKNTKGKK